MGKSAGNHIFLVINFVSPRCWQGNQSMVASLRVLGSVRLHRCWHPDSCPTHPPPPPRSQILQSRSEKTCGRSMLETTRWLKWCLMMMMMMMMMMMTMTMTVPCFFFSGFWSLLEYVARIAPLETPFASQLAGVVVPYLFTSLHTCSMHKHMLFTGHEHPRSNRHFPTFQPRLRCHDGRPWPARSYGSYGQWWHVSSLQTNNKEAKASRSGRP